MSRLVLLLLLLVAVLPLSRFAYAQNLTKLPMPQSFRTNELRVQWETDANPAEAVHVLDFGLASTSESSVLAQPFMAIAQPIHHFAILDASPGQLSFRADDLAGNQIDADARER